MKRPQLGWCAAVIALTAMSWSAGCSGTSDTAPFSSGGASATGTASTDATASGSGAGGVGSGQGTGGVNTTFAPGDLVITEIMNNPGVVNDDAGEWIEIHNATNHAVDLAGLVLQSGMESHTIASSVVIAPGGYSVLGVNAMTATNGGVPVDYQYAQIKLTNATDDVTILTADMMVLDTTAYDEASGLDPDGMSRSLDPEFLSATMNDTDLHWCAATTLFAGSGGDHGTPGKPNDACP